MKIEAFPAGAVMMATGGPGIVFGKSTNSVINTGAAAGACYRGGRLVRERRVHPGPPDVASPGQDKLRLMSESARGEGGRMWVPRTVGDTRAPEVDSRRRSAGTSSKRSIPAYGNLVPRDIATREIFKICLEGKGIDGKREVYLDLTHIPKHGARREARRDPGDLREVRRRGSAARADEGLPRDALLDGRALDRPTRRTRRPAASSKVRRRTRRRTSPASTPAARSTSRTTAQIDSAPTRCCPASTPAASAAPRWSATRGRPPRSSPRGGSGVRREKKRGRRRSRTRLAMRGRRIPHVALRRSRRRDDRQRDGGARQPEAPEDARQDRGARRPLEALPADRSSTFANREISFLNQLTNMLDLARVITKGALLRDESRGAHFKVKDLSRAARGGQCLSARRREVPEDDDRGVCSGRAEDLLPSGRRLARSSPGRGSTDVANDHAPIRFRVKRQDSPTSSPYWQEFEIPYQLRDERARLPHGSREEPGRPATAARRRRSSTTSACLEEVCGSCAMRDQRRPAHGLHGARRLARAADRRRAARRSSRSSATSPSTARGCSRR